MLCTSGTEGCKQQSWALPQPFPQSAIAAILEVRFRWRNCDCSSVLPALRYCSCGYHFCNRNFGQQYTCLRVMRMAWIFCCLLQFILPSSSLRSASLTITRPIWWDLLPAYLIPTTTYGLEELRNSVVYLGFQDRSVLKITLPKFDKRYTSCEILTILAL